MPGSKQKYNFERALSALRATQSRVGGRVAQDPTAEVNLPLDNLQSSDQKTGKERTIHVHQNAIDKNGGDTEGTNSTVEECPSHEIGEGGYDGISEGKKRGSDDSSTTQGHISFGNEDDDDDEFWMDSDDGQANTEKGKEMLPGKRGESLDIPKELEDTNENKLEMDGQNETIGVIIYTEEDGNLNKDDGVIGNGNGESPDGGADDGVEETPREYTVVTIETTKDELVENDVGDDQDVWHDSSEGNGNGQPSSAEGGNGESSNGTFFSNDGADKNIEEHSSSDGHSSGDEEDSESNGGEEEDSESNGGEEEDSESNGGEEEDSESNCGETSDSDDNDAGGDETSNNVCHNGSADPEIPSGGMDAATQTNFRQGFLKSFRKEDSGERKRRRNSEPLDMRSAGVDKKGRIFWDRVYDWTQRRRSTRPSLRGYIQGRGGGLMIPGNPLDVHPVLNTGPTTFLQAYINLMYILCVSTREIDQSKPQMEKLKIILQKFCFWTVGILAIGYSFDVLKFCTIEFIDHGCLHDYVQLGFLFVYGVTRIYSIILHGFNHKRLQDMIRSMNAASAGTHNGKYVHIVAYMLGGGSLLLAILMSLFGNMPFKHWSFKAIFLLRSYEMSHTLFIWSATNYSAATDKLDADYGSEVNGLSVAFAIPEIGWTFSGCLQDFVLGDLMLTSAASLFSSLGGYVKDVKSRPPDKVTYTEFKTKWNEYQTISRASDSFYKTCGTLLTLYHIYNMLQFAIFLRLILIKKAAQFLFVATAIDVVKSLATYIIAIKISEKNQACRNWVRHCAFHSLTRKRRKHKKLYLQAILMLDEMRDNPIGFGRDELFINKGFLITVLGMAASLFVMMTEYTDGDKKC